MPEKLFDQFGNILLPTDKCNWCGAPGAYMSGTRCMHDPPVTCPVHGKWTDINLVARGRRAVVKCSHYGEGGVVLYADPIRDADMYGSYSLQFYWPGLGSEMYTIPPQRAICPHESFDALVRDMRAGARPSPNRVPQPQNQTTTPGESLDD